MELIEEVELKNSNKEFMYVLQLDDLERKTFNSNFVVSTIKPSNELLLRGDTTEFLSSLKAERYEGLFKTHLECMYHVRLYEAMLTIVKYERLLDQANNIVAFDPFSLKFKVDRI